MHTYVVNIGYAVRQHCRMRIGGLHECGCKANKPIAVIRGNGEGVFISKQRRIIFAGKVRISGVNIAARGMVQRMNLCHKGAHGSVIINGWLMNDYHMFFSTISFMGVVESIGPPPRQTSPSYSTTHCPGVTARSGCMNVTRQPSPWMLTCTGTSL